jgi:hypothetical protein
VVNRYIDYVAGKISDTTHTTKVATEADGDFHFEMQSTNTPRPGGESPNGLVCEIDPPLQLDGWNALTKSIERYRKLIGKFEFMAGFVSALKRTIVE